ncbi:hypothetical protein Sipo8835_18440 [Streptomyces ipomoeae]|uniref:Uncharacterized protein n=2 Tax=Streptomyces ipomoeae TaxID=103232 RepID=L1L7Y4_9ACTN|nr:hypothetical protein STRIP9103_09278 [Streptomyces ipomoeae 91-03]TQE33313.1 hypothetical protein Sipo8835_18440 [Streptomyces ipomoeae]TQE39559.1 hypothetical protein Sipo7851_03440 [Streptomyces ipomoeae]
MTDDALSRPTVHALLADGTTVRIRPVAPGDHEQVRGLYEEMPVPPAVRDRGGQASGHAGAGGEGDTGSPGTPRRERHRTRTSIPLTGTPASVPMSGSSRRARTSWRSGTGHPATARTPRLTLWPTPAPVAYR